MAFRGDLRPFQVPAVERMLEENLLVAYEMGLGKTVLTIYTLEQLLETEEIEVALVVAPASLKYQWAREIAKFTDGALVTVIDGDAAQRRAQYQRAGRFEYVIVNYEQIVNDWGDGFLAMTREWPKNRWAMVLDEATAIKTPTAKRTRKVLRLRPRVRFALSGQPVENRPEEVFHIMRWVDEDVLGSPAKFDRSFIVRDGFGKVKRYRNLHILHKQLASAMIRKSRHDPDVAPHLPKVVEEVIPVQFDAAGARLYRAVASELLADLEALQGGNAWSLEAHYGLSDSQSSMKEAGDIMAKQLALRMLCDHPELIRISAGKYDDETTVQGSAYASALVESGAVDKVKASPKFRATAALVKEILDASPTNKVVLFSFFKGMLGMLADELKGYRPVLFTGDMNAKQKDAAKVHFQTDPKCRIFLSSDAGGYGVDLPQANYLISYDLPWSAGKIEQRNARIVRLSSTFESVTVLTMVMAGSVEQRMYDLLNEKGLVASAVVDGRGFDAKGKLDLNLATLKEFLRESSV